jgi:DNA-binding transcriptional LysR family regulator
LQLLEASAAKVAAQTAQGPLVVSCLATFMMRWLIPRLYAFSSGHPGIEVRLSASHAPVRFAEEGVDVAIRIGKPPWPRRVAAHRMFADYVGPVLAPSLHARHRLARATDLRHMVLLLADTRPEAWSDWARLTGTRGIEAVDSPRYEHTYFLLEAAASGLGVAVGSYALVKEDLASGRLVAPLGFTASASSYYLLHPKSTPSAKRISAFTAWIMSEAEKAATPAEAQSRSG